MKDLVWVDSDLRSNKTVGKADTPATLSHPDSLEAVTKDWNSGIEMGDQKGLNP